MLLSEQGLELVVDLDLVDHGTSSFRKDVTDLVNLAHLLTQSVEDLVDALGAADGGVKPAQRRGARPHRPHYLYVVGGLLELSGDLLELGERRVPAF